ncbi:MAG: phosphoribosylamine--glycine ligase [Gammaproteobacteria bacterium]
MQRILVIGAGGREHALAWALARDPLVTEVLVAPGNPGTQQETAGIRNVALPIDDHGLIADYARQHEVHLVIIGPEQPIADGLADRLRQRGIHCLAPSAQASRLESSKTFAKNLMDQAGIPTAQYQSFSSSTDALAFAQTLTTPAAIKADGLAGGKGVVLVQNKQEAQQAIRILSQSTTGDSWVIEELLHGREASFIVLTDGKTVLPLPTSEDHKARDNGDKGPNTGGMGAVSPSEVLTDDLCSQAMTTVIEPCLQALRDMDTPFCGFLYAGLMIQPSGHLKVLEFNCRLGDPEAQVLLMRAPDNFAQLCMATAQGQLAEYLEHAPPINWLNQKALTVVMASKGYPGNYQTGIPITGLERLPEDIKTFHSGTALNAQGQLVTDGGRVLSLTCAASDFAQARRQIHAAAQKIAWPGAFWRTDIGLRNSE